MEFYFDHEKLEVYRIAIQFVAWSETLLEDCKNVFENWATAA